MNPGKYCPGSFCVHYVFVSANLPISAGHKIHAVIHAALDRHGQTVRKTDNGLPGIADLSLVYAEKIGAVRIREPGLPAFDDEDIAPAVEGVDPALRQSVPLSLDAVHAYDDDAALLPRRADNQIEHEREKALTLFIMPFISLKIMK